MKKILLFLTAFVWLNADKNLIEIYQNAEFLHQSFDNVKDELIVAVPDGVQVDDVDVRSTCDVTKISLSKPLSTQNAKVSELKLQMSKIENEILALNDKHEFLHSIAPKASDFEILKASGEKFYELILADKTKQNELKEWLLELSKELDKQTQELRYQNLTINFACEPKSVDVKFELFEPSLLKNEVRASTLTQKLEISQSISVFNPLPTPLDNLSIAVYPFNYDARLAPDEFVPRYYGQNATNYDIQPRIAVAMSVNDSVKI
ncbi:hypothetical protein U5B43_02055 [Campylobacter sp. 9BO]|uniref:hypothetical protein n=1 Tax=Campylobacter sp. 9BO TaxID=3424759 RepID=UPI003D338A02